MKQNVLKQFKFHYSTKISCAPLKLANSWQFPNKRMECAISSDINNRRAHAANMEAHVTVHFSLLANTLNCFMVDLRSSAEDFILRLFAAPTENEFCWRKLSHNIIVKTSTSSCFFSIFFWVEFCAMKRKSNFQFYELLRRYQFCLRLFIFRFLRLVISHDGIS